MYPVVILEDKKIQIGSWVYTVKQLKTIWKLCHDLGNAKVFVNVPRAAAADLNELRDLLQEKF